MILCTCMKYAKTEGNNTFGLAEQEGFMEENNDEKKKIHKMSLFSKVIVGLVLATVLCYLISIPFTIRSRKLSEQAINVVKEMHIVEDSDMTIAEAFNKYFNNTRWYAYENDNEFTVVFSRYGMFDGKERYMYCSFKSKMQNLTPDYIFVGDKEHVFSPRLLPNGDMLYLSNYAQEGFLRTIAESVAE